MTNKLNSNEKVLNDINQTPAEKNQKKRFRNAVAATAVVAAGAVGLGVTSENDHHADQVTDKNNEQIMDMAKSAENIEIPQKGGDGGTYVDTEGRHIQMIVDQDGTVVHVDIATGQPIAKTSSTSVVAEQSAGTATNDQKMYENSEDFAGNDGHKAVEAEREANS